MPARLLQVVWISDATIRPPAPKMVVCVDPANGVYFRINSRGHWPESIPLPKNADHSFLDHDSYIECGAALSWDDFAIDESIKHHGDIGSISDDVARRVFDRVKATRLLTPIDRASILAALAARLKPT
jgi:hypothetical protein